MWHDTLVFARVEVEVGVITDDRPCHKSATFANFRSLEFLCRKVHGYLRKRGNSRTWVDVTVLVLASVCQGTRETLTL